MAITSYLSRIIYKEYDGEDLQSVDFAGSYKLLVRAKKIPAPMGAPNTVESTTLEDRAQTFEEGIQTSDSKEYTGNLEKAYLDGIDELKGKRVCLIQLYGTDGIGGEAKYAYVAQVTATPSDIGGVDEIVEMAVTAIPNTVPVKCTDDYTVVDGKNGTFTVTEASGGLMSLSDNRTESRKGVKHPYAEPELEETYIN